MVTIIITALFATALGQLSVNWYFTYISFVGEAGDRLDTFILTAGGTSVASFVAVLMQGMCEILADALLVSTELPLVVFSTIWRTDYILRFGVLTTC